jgi:hypothetical protein
MDPAAKGDFLAVQALVQLAAIMAAHHDGGSLLVIRVFKEALAAQRA